MGESFFGLENFGFICEWDKVNIKDTDTDGDGLTDAEEMGKKPEISSVKTENGSYEILVWHMKSNPNRKDSDQDGLYDYCGCYTGFSGHKSMIDYVKNPNPNELAVVASVDLSGAGLFMSKEDVSKT